ncbi:LysE family transporter [Thalassococcus sp. S3]|uniref:LysE family transporter n=1 Tax=Thalassococcus sp. S3 TaxID=2017482 RepID=UPI001024548E|nr:LysE family transporter [Thalassococcus sp. S3]QBF32184.1 transporter [Thalassococcus sp. S3]
MTLAALLSLALMQALIAISPGPAAVLTIRTAAAQGLRAGLFLSAGLAAAILLWASAALAGLSLIFEIAPWLQTGLRIIGGLFLIWIGWQMWRGAGAPMADAATTAPRGTFAQFRLGVLTNLANPKALAYFAAVFTGVMPVSPTLLDAALILSVIFLIEFAWYACVTLIFSRPGPRAAYARAKAWIERTFGGLLALLGLRIAAG